jgi:uncharacterized integral membrane protein
MSDKPQVRAAGQGGLMGRLIGFILIFALFLTFIVLNLENKCDVSLGFRTIQELPVFITAFVSFFLGMICAAPFAFSFSRKKKLSSPEAPLKAGKKPGKKGKDSGPLSLDEIGREDGPYGID